MPEPRSVLALAQELFDQLRRRRFTLGIPDMQALRAALAAGFGWSSRERFCEVMVSLWAKSSHEAETLRALFARLEWPENWTEERWQTPPEVLPDRPAMQLAPDIPASPQPLFAPSTPPVAVTRRLGTLPPLVRAHEDPSDRRLVFVPQYPLTHREIAQAFRRLRRPLRFGPATELDVDATVQTRSRSGVATPPVLMPRRRNMSRLLLLVDVQGSMAPYEPFIDVFQAAVAGAGWLQQVIVRYFHDVPSPDADFALLDELGPGFFPALDPVLGLIEPQAGEVFSDRALTKAEALDALLGQLDTTTVTLVVSDAGAARGRRDAERLLATAAFLKSLKTRVRLLAWINPVPRAHWAQTVAGHLSRHVPMYPMNRTGVHLAVNALRGQPVNLERPL